MYKSVISIIIPCYNQEKFIAETLESVLSQTYPNWECIVVNDGSKDGSQTIIESFEKKDNRIKLINIANAGVSAARNTGILNSKGAYIFPLDGDDKIHKDCLLVCIEPFLKDSNIRLVCPQGEMFGTETGPWVLPEYDYKTILQYNMIHNSSLYLRKDFDRVGGYRTNMVHGMEDWDFMIALLYGASKEQVVQTKETLFYYRTSNTGRHIKVGSLGKEEELKDLIVYNNFKIYQEYFPEIFNRILKYDYQNTMLEKKPVKLVVNCLNKLSELKNGLFKNSR